MVQGEVYAEEPYPNILYAQDGGTYTISGKSFLTIGGAYSVDKPYRLLYKHFFLSHYVNAFWQVACSLGGFDVTLEQYAVYGVDVYRRVSTVGDFNFAYVVDNAVNGQSRKQIRTALPWREERIQQAGIAPAAISRFRRVHNAIENIAEQVEQNLPGLDIVVVDIGIGITVNR